MTTLADQSEFRSCLVSLPDLKVVLSDLSVSHVLVGPNGSWSYEKLGRTRTDQDALEQEKLAALIRIVESHDFTRFGEWSVSTFSGVDGDLLMFERLPTSIADRLSPNILARLKKQVRAEGDGAIIGPASSGKSSLLCWLALQIPDTNVLLVSELPPNEMPGTHVHHVFPPSTRAERRKFERLLRLSGTVMWDRVSSAADLATLLTSTRAKRRWFTFDAASFTDAVGALTNWSAGRPTPKLKTVFSVVRSGIGRTEPSTFMTDDGEGWVEHHHADNTYVEAMMNLYGRPTKPVEKPPLTRPVDAAPQERSREHQGNTGMLPADSLSALRDEALPSGSHEPVQKLSEQTKHYIESPGHFDHSAVSGPSRATSDMTDPEMPSRSIANAAIQSVLAEGSEADEMNLEDLRITRSDIVVESDLVNLASSSSREEDYSGILDADAIDFELLDDLILEEVPDGEHTNPRQRTYDAPTKANRISDLIPDMASSRKGIGGSKNELSFGEKLELLRKRRHES